MSRNRSQENPKGTEQMIPMSAVNSIIQSLQSKVSSLENKYLEFVNFSSKIIKEAQSFLDQSINEHVINKKHPSDKMIENFTQQKYKLQDGLVEIEKMSIDFTKKKDVLDISVKFMSIIKRAKEKILEKLEDNKQKYSVQNVLLLMEEKLYKIICAMNVSEHTTKRISELEKMLKEKEKNYEMLQTQLIELKLEREKNNRFFMTDFKYENRLGSPVLGSRKSLNSGRLSPGLPSTSTLSLIQQKDHEIYKLKAEISHLQEKFIGFTGKLQRMSYKEPETSKIINIKSMLKNILLFADEFEDKVTACSNKLNNKMNVLGVIYLKIEGWKSKKLYGKHIKADEAHDFALIQGLEKIIEELKLEISKKDEIMKQHKEEYVKISKLYYESNDKVQANWKKNAEFNDELDEKNKKIEELIMINNGLNNENAKLGNYKNELDLEIMDLKDYFQSDIDNLSNKIEKLFSENLILKQKNEEIKEKYEKAMTDKEKLMVKLYENKESSSSESNI